jgi:hypothetical protein
MTQNLSAIDLLEHQHNEIRRLLGEVGDATDDEHRQAGFNELRALIAVHETAEEIVVRPVTRREVSDGEAIADARFEEENHGKVALAELEGLDTTSQEFSDLFAVFRKDIETHAKHEEELEFPALRDALDEATLRSMGEHIQRAESVAPTHPHPTATTTAANVVVGPLAAMVDRVRDALAS